MASTRNRRFVVFGAMQIGLLAPTESRMAGREASISDREWLKTDHRARQEGSESTEKAGRTLQSTEAREAQRAQTREAGRERICEADKYVDM
jgi:hypothetical protein